MSQDLMGFLVEIIYLIMKIIIKNNNNNNNNIKNGAYVINLDEYRDIGTHWVALYVNSKTIIYFDSFGVEHIPKEL